MMLVTAGPNKRTPGVCPLEDADANVQGDCQQAASTLLTLPGLAYRGSCAIFIIFIVEQTAEVHFTGEPS